MPTVLSRDNVEICYKDWGPKDGPVVVLSHGWPGCADSWEHQAFFLANNGLRVIAHDRRGHGRSSQPADGDDMDHYADDLAQVLGALELHDISLFGFHAGAGEVARYVGRYGTQRVARIGLISPVTPVLVRRIPGADALRGTGFDDLRARSVSCRSQLYRDLAEGPAFGFNRPGATRLDGVCDAYWLRGMMGGHKNMHDAIGAFSETDFTHDLEQFDRPTMIVHGEDDQFAPVDLTAKASDAIIGRSELRIYAGAPHGILETNKDELNRDMLAFVRT